MADTKPTLTAAELRAIGERVKNDWVNTSQENRDCAALYAAVVGMLEARIMTTAGRCAYMDASGDVRFCDTEDAAIDALLSGVSQ